MIDAARVASLRGMDRDRLSALDTLHRRCEGRPPSDELRVARLDGMPRANALRRTAALTLNERLAADARSALAKRRRALPAHACGDDAWLTRLAATLAHHRHAAAALAAQRKAYSQ